MRTRERRRAAAAVQPDTAYPLSGCVEGAYVHLGVTGGTDSRTPSATSWQQPTTSFTTSSSQTSTQVYPHGWYAQGTYYADDLSPTGPSAQFSYSATAGTAWNYNPSTGSFYTDDTPQSITTKAAYVTANGLGGMFAYSLEGDDSSGPLLSTLGSSLP